MRARIILLSLMLLTATARAEDYLSYYQKANAFEEVKNYTAAVAHYEKALSFEPRFANAYNGLGFVYLELEQHEKAQGFFKKAIELKKDFVLPLVNMGASLYRQGDLAEAEKYFQKAVEVDPQNVRALTNIAVIRFKSMDLPGAFYFYNRAKAADENYLKERYDKEKSLAEIRAARKKDPQNAYLKMLEEKIRYEKDIELP